MVLCSGGINFPRAMPTDLLEKARAAFEGAVADDNEPEAAEAMDVAATCLDDAVRGRNIEFCSSGRRELRLYDLYKRRWLSRSMYVVYATYLALALFERPAQPHLRAPFWATVCVEFACVCAFLCRLFHEMLFSAGGAKRFWSDHKHAAQVRPKSCTVHSSAVPGRYVHT